MRSRVVYLIDDDAPLRDSLGLLLTGAGLDVRPFGSAPAFLDSLGEVREGCVVTDVRMPGMSGMDLIGQMAARGVKLPVIVVTGHADVPLAVRAMKAGAVDLLEKPFKADDLLGAIRRALARAPAQAPAEGEIEEVRSRLATLSARETDVLDRLVRGQPNKVIAYEMGISPRTVEVHRANVMKKTQAANLSELIRMFLNVDLG